MHRKYPSAGGWDNTEYLLADVVDSLRSLFHLTLAANSEGGRYEPPELTDRPGAAERRAAERRQVERAKKSVRSLVDQLLPGRR